LIVLPSLYAIARALDWYGSSRVWGVFGFKHGLVFGGMAVVRRLRA
jgi:hypothetical protein